jgi:hypothetical protein
MQFATGLTATTPRERSRFLRSHGAVPAQETATTIAGAAAALLGGEIVA